MGAMRRATIILLALALLAVAGQPASAQTSQITGFRLSDSSDGAARDNFPSGTRVIYAILDYTDMNNTSIGVAIIDPNGVVLYNESEDVSGSGTKTFDISGTAILSSYQNLASNNVQAAQQNLDNAIAASQKPTKVEWGRLVVSYSMSLASISRSLSGLVTDATQRANLSQAATSLDQVSQLGQELTVSLPDDQMADHLNQMKAGLDAGVNALGQTLTSLGDGSTLYFPDVSPGGQYLAKALLDNELVQSIDWTVGSGATPMPTATTGQQAPSPTPTATPVASQPTATQQVEPTATPPAQPTATQPASQPTATLVQPTTTRQPAGQTVATATVPAQPTQAASTPTILVSAASTAEAATATAAPAQMQTTPTTAASQAPTVAATATQAPAAGTTQPAVALAARVTPAGRSAAGQPAEAVPSDAGGLPLGTAGIVGGAIALGLIALWFRRKM